MSQVYVRSDQLKDKVFDVKLQINEWKVLFAIDGKKDARELADFLEMDETEVSATLQKLTGLSFVQSINGEATFEEEREAASAVAEATEEDRASTAESLEEEETTPVAAPPEAEEEAAATEEETEESFEDFWDADVVEDDAGVFAEAEGASVEQEPPAEDEGEAIDLEASDDVSFDEVLTEDSDVSADLDFSEEEMTPPTETEPAEPEESSDSEDIDALIGDILEEEEESADEESAQSDLSAEETAEDEFDLDSIFDDDLDLDIAEEVAGDELDIVSEQSEPAEVAEDFFAPPTEAPVAEEEKPATILVVDDSVVIRKMVEIALENENYHIVSVATGKEALTYLDENTPDLIILDIMLSDVNGLDVLKAIKASKDVPVVMLSAKDTPRETTKAKQLGADDFIPKPFKDEELVGKIRELIRH